MIPLAEPVLDGNEREYLLECLESGYLSSVGPLVERFEREFARAVGSAHAVACGSGTAALHVALRLAGAGPGKLVAVSDLTFIASANAVTYTGADILLVDSESATWNMNTQLLYEEVVRRAKRGERIPDVIEIVHVLGHPAQMEPLLALREEFGIPIVEDAAESLGASWLEGPLAGRQVGSAGEFGCFSFNGNKIITTGGGGMITTDDADRAAAARHLTTQAKLPGPGYRHDAVGYNYRLNSLAAAVGLAQLERLSNRVAAKRAIAARYDKLLTGLPVSPAPSTTWARPTYWLYSVLLDEQADGDHFVESLSGREVQARRVWPPLHVQAPYVGCARLGGDVADHIYRRGLSLPSSAGLSLSQQQLTADALVASISDAGLKR
ncbi:DegT/DnrJ/EryC1/StrS family aminotransferase [Amycolatopsis pithecellobii]|uniref:DegT/DnrJ/EryC1/StrS aminotransferase n=1 Tax=Amycolatopsis pithecellobii TaxID=664692 RepID=A0A6N7Z9L8_9PSEU|nr:DegT/DnrJ/EryC1/StrS family aminotransferase [Amycolatopsis pithecellobii]MTD58426.1 DegT/DnrJ/EryC1/StrS aminotransferase [Amycolatopsis pithecellobii]